jgi:CDP-paratose 2-epimerase
VYGENVDTLEIEEQPTRFKYKHCEGVSEQMSVDLTGHTPYGASKYVGDLYAQEYAHIYNMRTAVFRMSCIYGTRQFGFEDQGWVAWFVIAALTGQPLTIYGNGKQVRDMLFVTDLVQAFEKFIQSNIQHGVFNIGGGPKNTASLLEFISRLEKKTGKKIPLRFEDWRPSDQKVYISDIRKVEKTLGWKPAITWEEGQERLTEWVMQNKALFESASTVTGGKK